MVKEIRGRGFPASKARVDTSDACERYSGTYKRRYKATTDSQHPLPVAPTLLERNFAPSAPNQVWSADLAYVWTDEGWLYLGVLLDLFNREVVGWSIKPGRTSDIVVDALTWPRSAISRRLSSRHDWIMIQHERKLRHDALPLEDEKSRECRYARRQPVVGSQFACSR